MRTGARVRAPELRGAGGWINTDRPLSLTDLRGRIVLLDFWTSCCANCLHVTEELRPLEAKYGAELVVIGVHSPKFPHEADHGTVVAAVRRNAITHPVLDDPQLLTWRQYAVKAWPTLVLIDPAGYVVAQAAGEGQVSGLDAMVADLVATHDADRSLRRDPFEAGAPLPGSGSDWQVRAAAGFYFPAKAVAWPAERGGGPSRALVADAGNNRIVELDLVPGADPVERRRIGRGTRGHADGGPAQASFTEPNGLTLLPTDLAERQGYDVVVADTVGHRLRGVRLADGAVSTVLDLAGHDLRTVTGVVPDVASPWDVAWWPARNRLVVAAAGVHLLLEVDLDTAAVDILAGTTVEGLRDGPGRDAWLAQPSGLAVLGQALWFVDSETSALRWVDPTGTVHTAVGEGLFDFGHVDGPGRLARFQHPLGVTALADGTLAVADTYNGAVRRYDPARDEVSTLASHLAEPSGVVELGGTRWVVESEGSRLSELPAAPEDVVDGPAQHGQRPVTDVGPGRLTLRVLFTPAPGRKIDISDGPGTRLDVSASPSELLADGVGAGPEFTRGLTVVGAPGATGVVHVSAQAASCDDDPSNPHPACYLSRQDWGVPVRVVEGGPRDLELVLLG
ncbi:MAG: thioredoxin-like domain-containing protein [bacterium]